MPCSRQSRQLGQKLARVDCLRVTRPGVGRVEKDDSAVKLRSQRRFDRYLGLRIGRIRKRRYARRVVCEPERYGR